MTSRKCLWYARKANLEYIVPYKGVIEVKRKHVWIRKNKIEKQEYLEFNWLISIDSTEDKKVIESRCGLWKKDNKTMQSVAGMG